MKKKLVVIMVLLFVSVYTVKSKEEPVISSFRNNRELISTYINGYNVTNEYTSALEKALESVKEYLCLTTQELENADDCILGNKYITIELIYDGVKYTFCCDLEGKILSMNKEEDYFLDEWDRRRNETRKTE